LLGAAGSDLMRRRTAPRHRQEAKLKLENCKTLKDAAHKLRGRVAEGRQAVKEAEVGRRGLALDLCGQASCPYCCNIKLLLATSNPPNQPTKSTKQINQTNQPILPTNP